MAASYLDVRLAAGMAGSCMAGQRGAGLAPKCLEGQRSSWQMRVEMARAVNC
jgi:hypothetical protein